MVDLGVGVVDLGVWVVDLGVRGVHCRVAAATVAAPTTIADWTNTEAR